MECRNLPTALEPLRDRRGYKKHTFAMTDSGRKSGKRYSFFVLEDLVGKSLSNSWGREEHGLPTQSIGSEMGFGFDTPVD